MASSKELRALIVLAGKIDPSLQTAMLKASNESLKLSQHLKESTKNASHLSDVFKGSFLGNVAGNAFTSLTSKLWEVAGESVKMASDLIEIQNVVDVTFGQSATQINAWAQTALSAYGESELMAKRYSSTMGAMLKSSGIANKDLVTMSENLAGLAGDLASFYNLSQDEAFQKIQSGLAGEIEPLRDVGINMTVANLQAYALSKGIKTSYQQMDQASQTILRYNYLLDRTMDVQGDFKRTSHSFANELRTFDTSMMQLTATIAQQALPYLTQWLDKANTWAQNADIAAMTQKAADIFSHLAAAVQWGVDVMKWMVDNRELVAGAAAAIGAAFVWTAAVNAVTSLKTSLEAISTLMATNPVLLAAMAAGFLGHELAYTSIGQNSSYKWLQQQQQQQPQSRFNNYLKNPPLGNVGHNATGTDFWRGGPTWVGEKEPELLDLPRGSRITPASKLGGNITIAPVISVTASGGQAQEIALAAKEAVLSVIEEYFDGKGRVAFG